MILKQAAFWRALFVGKHDKRRYGHTIGMGMSIRHRFTASPLWSYWADIGVPTVSSPYNFDAIAKGNPSLHKHGMPPTIKTNTMYMMNPSSTDGRNNFNGFCCYEAFYVNLQTHLQKSMSLIIYIHMSKESFTPTKLLKP